jgi:hypothetical protein
MRDKVIWLVGTECAQGKDEEYHEWYETIHIPMLLKVPGVRDAARYEIMRPSPDYPRFLAIHSLGSEDRAYTIEQDPKLLEARRERIQRWGETGITVSRAYYRLIST